MKKMRVFLSFNKMKALSVEDVPYVSPHYI